jgi:hypothetical protein
VFSSHADMDEHVEKMVKQFAMMNASHSTCTTPMMNIEDRPLMIMADMENRKPSPCGRAFPPSEGEWVFDFSMVVALPLLYGINVIRNTQQVTTDGDRQIYNPLDILSRDRSSPWYGVKHMLCTVHLVEQQFDNDVRNKEGREGIVYQVKNWIRSFTNYCESEIPTLHHAIHPHANKNATVIQIRVLLRITDYSYSPTPAINLELVLQLIILYESDDDI